MVTVIDALPQQQQEFTLASLGFGAKVKMFDYLNGSLDLGIPLIGQPPAKPWNPLLVFRVWAEF